MNKTLCCALLLELLAARPLWAQRATPVAPLPLARPAVPLPPPLPLPVPFQLRVVGRLPGFFVKPLPSSTVPAPAAVPRPQPVIIVNARVIISYAEFAALDPYTIEKLFIYNSKGTETPAQWRSLTENGIVAVTLKRQLACKAKRLTAYGRRLGLSGLASYKLDGQPLTDRKLRISPQAIAGFDIVRGTTAAPGLVLNVRLSQTLPASKPAPRSPDGSPQIYIRGVAGR